MPNKTYTAPDGSVYRIEPDGSVTRLKSGKPILNKPSSRYQITPDGKIYRVESDGSITYLGNAEEYPTPTPDISINPSHKKNSKWIWLLLGICIVGTIVMIIILSNHHALLTGNKYINTLLSDIGWFNKEMSVAGDEKNFFQEVTMFRGGDKQDDESGFVEMIFYPNGECSEYTRDCENSSFCLPSYYIIADKIYLNYGDSRTMMIDIVGDSFKYGYILLKKTPMNHQTYYLDNPMRFENYTDDGIKKTAKYYPDGSCTLTDSGSNKKTNGAYSIKEGIIHIKWEDGTSEEYYYNSEAYRRDDISFWGRSFTEDDYDDEYIQNNGYFPRETNFYGENDSNRLRVTYYPDGKCNLDGYILEEGNWIRGTSEGKYHIKNDTIYVIWNDWVNESYRLENNQYNNDGLILKLRK